MQQHSTKVFGDIAYGIAAFIQWNFAQSGQATTPTSPALTQGGGPSETTHLFTHKGTVIQYDVLPSTASQKPLL